MKKKSNTKENFDKYQAAAVQMGHFVLLYFTRRNNKTLIKTNQSVEVIRITLTMFAVD